MIVRCSSKFHCGVQVIRRYNFLTLQHRVVYFIQNRYENFIFVNTKKMLQEGIDYVVLKTMYGSNPIQVYYKVCGTTACSSVQTKPSSIKTGVGNETVALAG